MKKVTVYSTSTCPWCDRVKDYLKDKNYDFAEVDVGRDPGALQKMVDLSGQMGVPVVVVDQEVVVGYNRNRLEELLN